MTVLQTLKLLAYMVDIVNEVLVFLNDKLYNFDNIGDVIATTTIVWYNKSLILSWHLMLSVHTLLVYALCSYITHYTAVDHHQTNNGVITTSYCIFPMDKSIIVHFE